MSKDIKYELKETENHIEVHLSAKLNTYGSFYEQQITVSSIRSDKDSWQPCTYAGNMQQNQATHPENLEVILNMLKAAKAIAEILDLDHCINSVQITKCIWQAERGEAEEMHEAVQPLVFKHEFPKKSGLYWFRMCGLHAYQLLRLNVDDNNRPVFKTVNSDCEWCRVTDGMLDQEWAGPVATPEEEASDVEG